MWRLLRAARFLCEAPEFRSSPDAADKIPCFGFRRPATRTAAGQAEVRAKLAQTPFRSMLKGSHARGNAN
jgi:hypothetical protein